MRPIDADALMAIYKMWIPQLSVLKEDEGDKRGVETCIAMLEEAPTIDPATLAPRWRDAKTDPPKEGGEYLVYMSSGRYMLLRWNNKGHIWTGNGLNYTKQKTELWAELPQSPKREGKNDA